MPKDLLFEGVQYNTAEHDRLGRELSLYWYGEIILGAYGGFWPSRGAAIPAGPVSDSLSPLTGISPAGKETLNFRYGFEVVSGRRSRK
jgi:hypothetical protein